MAETPEHKRPQFGTRTLCDSRNVFEHNAWDNVVWDEEQEKEAKQKVDDQLAHALGQDLQDQYEREAADFWDSFYGIHQNRFFKNRHWLFTEFPELSPDVDKSEPNREFARTNTENESNNEEYKEHISSEVCSGIAKETSRVSEEKKFENLKAADTELVDNGCGKSKSVQHEVKADDHIETPVSDLGNEHVCMNGIISNDLSNKGIVPQDYIESNFKDMNIQEHVNHENHRQNISEVMGDSAACSGAFADTRTAKTSFPGDKAKQRILEKILTFYCDAQDHKFSHRRLDKVGCGVGNTVFPILQTNNDPDLMVYCCDFSATAVNLVKENIDYDPGRCHAFICDIADESAPVPFPDGSLDIIILIFVLSAIHPDKMQAVINRLARLLKPGGTILFRDYGRYDMAQLRFKKGRCLSENFYVRGDGTRVYFFTQDELRDMLTKAGLVEKQNLIDRRLQVNRGKQLKMYRVWIQCKYSKPLQ